MHNNLPVVYESGCHIREFVNRLEFSDPGYLSCVSYVMRMMDARPNTNFTIVT